MASLSYGKRMLKAGLQKSGYLKKSKRISPDEDAKKMCIAGLDKDGFDVRYISDYKGFRVFATRQFKSGDFLLQYCGEKISKEEGEKRLAKSTENKIFFYSFKGKYLCIDAEGTTGHICQYVNDAADGNSVMKLKVFNDTEFLCLFAKHDIMPGDELLYDYGDDINSWWRKKAFEARKLGDDAAASIDATKGKRKAKKGKEGPSKKSGDIRIVELEDSE